MHDPFQTVERIPGEESPHADEVPYPGPCLRVIAEVGERGSAVPSRSRRMLARLAGGFRDWEEVIGSLPRMARDVMRFAREQKVAVQLQHQHLGPSVHRLVFGLLTSALFVGSALLWANKAPPLAWDVSVVGVIGVAISTVLGSRLLWAIQKSGKLEE